MKTIKAYIYSLMAHLEGFGFNSNRVKKNVIQNFLVNFSNKKLPENINTSFLNSIKDYYNRLPDSANLFYLVKHKRMDLGINILSKAEVSRLIRSIKNKQHRVIISLAYEAGLSSREIVSLRFKDFCFFKHLIRIENRKGSISRIAILPENIVVPLKRLALFKSADDMVFTSERGGYISPRYLQFLLKRYLKRCGIMKEIKFLGLRHSFAIHLIEEGFNLQYVVALLGLLNLKKNAKYFN